MGRSTARFRVSPDVLAREVDDGLVLLLLPTGATWRLNRLGAAIWRQLEAGVEQDAIIAEIESRYRDESATIRRDVELLLEDLRKHHLVEPASQP